MRSGRQPSDRWREGVEQGCSQRLSGSVQSLALIKIIKCKIGTNNILNIGVTWGLVEFPVGIVLLDKLRFFFIYVIFRELITSQIRLLGHRPETTRAARATSSVVPVEHRKYVKDLKTSSSSYNVSTTPCCYGY